ncbi:MAG: response regulator transcription factor [Candidatus Saccharimonadales bacterium]
MRLLLVEDEEKIGLPLKKAFERHLYAVDYETNGREAYVMAGVNGYDCIILDINLPDMDGVEITRKLRGDGVMTPILMLTARGEQEDVVEGFENGADDYLRKPFHFQELLLRINSLVKRNSAEKSEVLSTKQITLNPRTKKAYAHGSEIKLNAKEFGILEYLLRNKGCLASQEELLEHVWDSRVNIFTQTVRTNIKTLRQKIDPDKLLIETVKGSGYRINDD